VSHLSSLEARVADAVDADALVRAHPAYAAEIERDDPLGERRDRGSIWPFRYI